MKHILMMTAFVLLTGCYTVPPGHDPNGPGNSENAPGHNKHRSNGPGNSDNAPGHNKDY
ncbi:MAG: hypothetical protein H0W85_02205 [Methylotenera sp.]|nr:hypothetical protein [Methylotenera sp.]